MAAETFEEFFNVTEEQTDRLANYMYKTILDNYREGYTSAELLEMCLAECKTEGERLWTIYTAGNFNGTISLTKKLPQALGIQRLYLVLETKKELWQQKK